MKKSMILSATAFSMLLTACGSRGPTRPVPDSVDGVWIYAPTQCAFSSYVVSPPGAAAQRSLANIVDPFLTSFIGVGIDALASALTEAGKARTIQRNGMAGFELSSTRRPACIEAIDGRMVPDDHAGFTLTELLGAKPPIALPPPLDTIKWAEKPRWFFEGELHYSGDGKAVAIKPTRLVGAPRSTGAFGRSASDLIIFVGFSGPASLPAADSTFSDKGAVTRLSFSGVRDGIDFMSAPKGGGTSLRIPLSAWTPFELPKEPQPATIWVNLVEVTNQNEFLTMLGAALSGSKEGVKKGLTEQLVPSAREQAQQAAASASAAALDAYGKAVADAAKSRATFETTISDYCAAQPAERPAKFGALVDANLTAITSIRAANLAATTASQPIPFDAAHQIATIRSPDDVGC